MERIRALQRGHASIVRSLMMLGNQAYDVGGEAGVEGHLPARGGMVGESREGSAASGHGGNKRREHGFQQSHQYPVGRSSGRQALAHVVEHGGQQQFPVAAPAPRFEGVSHG